ncbi:hypothetical protein, partial [Fulvivirga sp.]|uniref:beta strand repeat-containing protein n=1 Tax=Fulvivirga sp. TaxID=1931237 RepID=UPI0032EDF028
MQVILYHLRGKIKYVTNTLGTKIITLFILTLIGVNFSFAQGTLTTGTSAGDVNPLQTTHSSPSAPQQQTIVAYDFTMAAGATRVKFTGLTIHLTDVGIDWANVLEDVELHTERDDNASNQDTDISTGFSGTNNTDISFTLNSANNQAGDVQANQTDIFEFRFRFKTNIGAAERMVIDNASIEITISNSDFTGITSGSVTGGPIVSDVIPVIISETQYAITAQPTTVGLNQDFSLTVQGVDANGNYDLNNTSTVSIARGAGTGTLSSVLDGDLSSDFVAGSFTWTDLQFDTNEIFDIVASGSLTSATSASIDVLPSLTSVTAPSDGTYVFNQNVDFTVNFDEAMTVTNMPRIPVTLDAGGTEYATYVSGSPGAALTFRYTVDGDDLDANGISISSPIDLNGGTINDSGGNPGPLTFTPPNTSAILVDGIRPTISSVSVTDMTYEESDNIDISVLFDEIVNVTNTPRIQFTMETGGTVNANYQSGSGSNTLIFRYNVAAGVNDNNGITLISPIQPNGGTISDANTNPAILTYALPNTTGVLVDALDPTITNFALPSNTTYGDGQNLDFQVTYDEVVQVTGTPRIQLTLNIGGTVYANYLSGDNSTVLTFRYTVNTGDEDLDGITVASSIDLNTGSILDNVGRTADLTYTVGSTAGILVDAKPASILSVTAPANNTYLNGQNVNFTVNFDENVIVSAPPRIQITLASGTVYANYLSGSGSSALVFRYMVGNSDLDGDGIVLTSPIQPNGGTITDMGGNNALLTFAPPVTTGILVDGVIPMITSVVPPGPGTYILGNNLDFVVNYNDNVNVTPTPRISITLNSGTVFANYLSGSGTNALTYRYTVAAGNLDNNGITMVSPIQENTGSLQDASGNTADLTYTPPVTSGILIDGAAPRISTITRASPATSPTNANVVEWDVAFDQVVFNVDELDFTVAGAGNVQMVTDQGGNVYRVTVSGGGLTNYDGTVTLGINGATDIIDVNTNPFTNFTPTGTNNNTFVMDNSGARVSSITLANSNPHNAGINAGSVNFNVAFNETVTGVDISDFLISASNLIGTPTVSGVTGSGQNYTVTVNGFDLNDASASGTLNLDLNATGTILDALGNDNTNPAVLGADETYTIINPEPSEDINQVSFISTGQTSNTIGLSWTNSVTDQIAYQHLILVKESGSFPNPTDGSFINNDLDLTTGTTGQLAINVPHGQNTFNVTGLNSGTSYDFEIYPYTNNGANVNYRINSPATLTQATPVASFSRLLSVSSAVTISSLTDTQAEAIAASPNFRFNIHDDGGITDDNIADNAKTEFTQIVFTQGTGNAIADWTTVIAGARLEGDEGNDLNSDDDGGQVTIQSDRIIFSGITHGNNDLGEVDDDEEKTYTLRVWLHSPMPDGVDNQDLVFELIAASGITSVPGSSGFDGAFNTINSIDGRNSIDIDATTLTWTTQPANNIGVLSTFAIAPVITAEDAVGNRDVNFFESITAFSNTGGITMNNSPLGLAFSAGSFTLSSSFSYQTSGNGTLNISTPSIASAQSNPVTVSYSDGTTVMASGFIEENNITPVLGSYAILKEWIITDDASPSLVNDGVPTRITQFVITAAPGPNAITNNWTEAFTDLVLSDPTTTIFTFGSATANSIIFSAIPNTDNSTIGFIEDDGSITVRLYADLNDDFGPNLENIVDNMNLVLSVTTSDITTIAQSSTIATGQNVVSDNTKNFIRITASTLNFEQQPDPTAQYGTTLATQPIAVARDNFGNRDKDYIGPINVTNTNGNPVTNSTAIFNNGSVELNPGFFFTPGPGADNDDVTQIVFTDANVGSITASTNAITISYSGESDIIRDVNFSANSGTGYNSNIPYQDFQGTTITDNSNSIVLEGFTVRDGGGSSDADGSATIIESITFNISNSENLRTIELYDATGTTPLSSTGTNEQAVIGNNVTFSGLSLTAPDNGSVDFTIRANYQAIVDDNETITFSVTNVVESSTASQFLNADGRTSGGTIPASSLSADENRIEVTRTQLVFDNIGGASLNTDFTPAITVRALDNLNNTDLDFTEAVSSYSNFSTSETSQLATSNNPSGSFSSGVFIFPTNFQFTESGDGVTITIETNTFDGSPLSPGVSNSFDIISSFESYITFVSSGGDIPYINFPPNADIDDSESYALATYQLHDGQPLLNGGVFDVDGAPTTINEITISITNPQNLDKVGIFDMGGTQYGSDMPAAASITFTGVNFSAGDDLTNNFLIKANFQNTSPNITDNDAINITITDVVTGSGSQFEQPSPGVGGQPDGFGGFIAPAPANNAIEVTATEFFFNESPATIEGVNIALANIPQILVQDANSILDLDFSGDWNLVTPSAGIDISLITDDFIGDGTLNLTELTYTSTGNGTLNIFDPTGTIAPAGNASSSTVDVINTLGTQLTNGIEANDIPVVSGKQNIAILGFSLSSAFNNGSDPRFNELRVQFVNPGDLMTPVDISSTFQDFRLFQSLDNSIDPTFANTTDITSGFSLTNGNSTLTFSGLDLLIDDNLANQYFFLVVNVSVNADASTLPVVPLIVDNEITMSAGSFQVTSPIIGLEYDFEDRK